ncbi:MAG: hypothetical protein FWG65_02445, partial [Turicibacter sp.]|nr:hypothetical protein [Turicibacter sp.]
MNIVWYIGRSAGFCRSAGFWRKLHEVCHCRVPAICTTVHLSLQGRIISTPYEISTNSRFLTHRIFYSTINNQQNQKNSQKGLTKLPNYAIMSRAEQSRAEQSRAEQSRAEQSRAEQS